MQVRAIDKKFLVRDVPSVNLEIVSSEENYLIDSHGKKYIDFFMGWCVGNLGWGNEAIQSSIKNFTGPDYVSPAFLYKPWVELAELLASITPGKLKKCFRATGGAEAVELALRTANAYTGRSRFISIEGSYHGNTIGTMSVGSSYFKNYQPGLLFSSYKIKPPLDNAAANNVEKILKQKNIAALIMEPIICNLGVLIPEQAFMNKIQALCKKYGTLLIMDEVATGFGRTGKLFASEHFAIKPDIMCLAKAITGGYAAMGATITTEAVAKAIAYDSSYYSTYGWHPLSVAAALANIKYMLNHQKKLQNNVAVMSDYFHDRLSNMPFKYSAELQIIGLAIGIKFQETHYARRIVEKAREKGLLLSPSGEEGISLFPALNIGKQIAQAGLDILEQCL